MKISAALLLKNPLIRSLLVIVIMSLIIWLTGSYWLPATSVNSRQILIGLGFSVWFFFQLIPYVYQFWLNNRLLNKLKSRSSHHTEQLVTEERLISLFNEAISILKMRHFQSRRPQQRGTQFLYQLPWYMMIGAPGSGKTTALINSGLDFPLAETLGKNAIRGVGGTRHCDWWFTNDAILLDTAGRYTSQESMRTRDAHEWQSFIQLLKRYRPRQPINGVIMTISMADLLSHSTESRRIQATSLLQRMTELHQQTGIQFPVYVMITKTDLLKGFMNYFGALDKQQRDQFWGFTFPDTRPQNILVSFHQQFNQLHHQLIQALPEKMVAENDLNHRANCFLFPQEFAALQPLIAEYIKIIFSTAEEVHAWPVRGIFFTSGTQEGLPFDRIMGELARKLQLPQEERPSAALWDSVNRASPIPANKGQSFFIHNLLSDIIFAEQNLAGYNQLWEQNNRRQHHTLYGILAGVLLLLSVWWFISYFYNQRYLEQITAKVEQLTEQKKSTETLPAEKIVALLPFLDNLANLAQSETFSLSSPPSMMQAGFYKGTEVNHRAQRRYQRALKSQLFPGVVNQIITILRKDNGEDHEYSHDALLAYQMLYQPHIYKGEFLRHWIMKNIQRDPSIKISPQQLKQLNWHLIQLLDNQVQTSPHVRDNTLMMNKSAKHHGAQNRSDDREI